jgi:hypothetical protein
LIIRTAAESVMAPPSAGGDFKSNSAYTIAPS